MNLIELHLQLIESRLQVVRMSLLKDHRKRRYTQKGYEQTAENRRRNREGRPRDTEVLFRVRLLNRQDGQGIVENGPRIGLVDARVQESHSGFHVPLECQLLGAELFTYADLGILELFESDPRVQYRGGEFVFLVRGLQRRPTLTLVRTEIFVFSHVKDRSSTRVYVAGDLIKTIGLEGQTTYLILSERTGLRHSTQVIDSPLFAGWAWVEPAGPSRATVTTA